MYTHKQFSAPSVLPACPYAWKPQHATRQRSSEASRSSRADLAAKNRKESFWRQVNAKPMILLQNSHQAADCILQELQPDKVDLQQACQLIDAKVPALATGQGSTADQQPQGSSADGFHGLNGSTVAADAPDKQFSKAGSKAGSKTGSRSVSLKGKKQSQSDDATKGLEDKAKARSKKAGKPAVQKATVDDKKPKTVGKDKVSSKGTSSSPPKSRYRLFWRQQWAKLRTDHPSITMTDANKLISQDWKQLDDTARQTYQ